MRPRLEAARERLDAVLARQRGASAGELAQALSVSVPTLHRLLREAGERVVAAGRARRTRHALRRPLRGDLGALPVYAIDEAGSIAPAAALSLVQPQGSLMTLPPGWPVPAASADGWWDGLPYPLEDMRPLGFLGRAFARACHAVLGVPQDPSEWSDDDTVHVLSRRGWNTVGNLIVGDAAGAIWLERKARPDEPLRPAALGRRYAQLAQEAITAGVPESSAAGEFPKFVALRERSGSATPHVLVKFSGAGASAAERRWADLLVCEHLALETMSEMPDIDAARSRIVQSAGRTFLEVERFDRHGAHGRSPLVSMETINAAFLGDATSDWTRLAARLAALRLLDARDAQRIELIWWFGRLIANTDMHLGNLSFHPRDGIFALAPSYDMLPMLFAPLPGGEVPVRNFDPPLPLPAQRPAWRAACEAAVAFWRRATGDARISESFRPTARACADRLRTLLDRV
jgi:hypothetical protein